MTWSLRKATESLLLPLPWQSEFPIASLWLKFPPTPRWSILKRSASCPLMIHLWQRLEILRGLCSGCWLSPCERIFLEIFFLTHGLPFASSVPMKVYQSWCPFTVRERRMMLAVAGAGKCCFWGFLGNIETPASVHHLCSIASDRRMGRRLLLARVPRMIYPWPICKMHLEN